MREREREYSNTRNKKQELLLDTFKSLKKRKRKKQETYSGNDSFDVPVVERESARDRK